MYRLPLNGIQKTCATAALFLCAGSSAWAGWCCDWYIDPLRPYCSPACKPNWGYHETSWKQFPEANSQSQSGDYCPSCQMGESGLQWNGAVNSDASGAIVIPPGQTVPYESMQSGGLTVPPQQYAPSYPEPDQFAPPTQYQTPPTQYQTPQTHTLTPIPDSSISAPTPAPSQMQPMPSPGVNAPAYGQPNTINPVPVNPGNTQPVPQPQESLPAPMPMPMSGRPAAGHAYQTSYTGQYGAAVPQQPRALFTRRLLQGRMGEATPAYQQPPIVTSAGGQPAPTVQGVSYPQNVIEPMPPTEESVPLYKRLIRKLSWSN